MPSCASAGRGIISLAPPSLSIFRRSDVTKKQTPSYAKRKTQHTISIINATYRVCQGRRPNLESGVQPYRVYKLTDDKFLVPATPDDFHHVAALQAKTEARHATVRLSRKDRLPRQQRRTSCIVVTMPRPVHEILKGVDRLLLEILRAKDWSYDGNRLDIFDAGSPNFKLKFGEASTMLSCEVSPDSCLQVDGAPLPFLVIEVAHWETDQHVADKITKWTQGSKKHVRIIIYLCVRDAPGTQEGFRILATVVKPMVRSRPTPENPSNFVMEENFVVNLAEIWPTQSETSFRIYLDDVLPKYWPRTSGARSFVTINLSVFYERAERAAKQVTKQAEQRASEGGSSPYDPNQEASPRPAPSVQAISDNGSEVDSKERDGDYEPDDSGNDSPYEMIDR